MFKKLLIGAALIVLTSVTAQAQYWYTNTSTVGASNALVTSSRWVISEISTTTGSGAVTVNFYDSNSTNATNVVSAYVSTTWEAYTNTTIFTNNQALIITNQDVGIRYYNVTNALVTNTLPVIYSISLPANSTATKAVDLVTVRGLSFYANTNVNLNIKYRPWSTGINP